MRKIGIGADAVCAQYPNEKPPPFKSRSGTPSGLYVSDNFEPLSAPPPTPEPPGLYENESLGGSSILALLQTHGY